MSFAPGEDRAKAPSPHRKEELPRGALCIYGGRMVLLVLEAIPDFLEVVLVILEVV